MPTHDSDRPMEMLGVPGRLTHRTTKPGQAAGLWCNQRWISQRRPTDYGAGCEIQADVRFDDECGNGHNTFAITATVTDPNARGREKMVAGGCMHDEIAKAFPELAPLIKWHLTSSDGPLHYIANTLYLAGDRDHWGKRAGEPHQFETVIQFGANPIKHKLPGKFVAFLAAARPHPGRAAFDFEVIGIDHDDRKTYGTHYTFGGYGARWHDCPFRTEATALDFLQALQTCDPQFMKVAIAWGEGKARQFDAARSAAIWPEATDAELSAEPDVLRAALTARHPALMKAFRDAIDATGFVWTPELLTAGQRANETEG